MSTFAQTLDQTIENETVQTEMVQNTVSDKMSFSEQIAKLSKLSKIEKIKLVFFCFVNAHIYSMLGKKLNRDFLLTPNDITTTNEKLTKFVYDRLKPFISRSDKEKMSEEELNKVNEDTDRNVKNILLLLTDSNFCELMEDYELIKTLMYSFFSYDQDFSHPFVLVNGDFDKLSNNTKKSISTILQYHMQLIHDEKTSKYHDSLFDRFTFHIKTINELLEFALFTAKYSQFSSIGYFINMKYTDDTPLDVFNKNTVIDQIIESYNI